MRAGRIGLVRREERSMKTQFDRLVLSPDHRTITACGAIIWEPGDDHCRIHVDLSQSNGTIAGSRDTENYGIRDRCWTCDVAVSTPHDGRWDPNLLVHCVGRADPPTSTPWDPQDLPLETKQAQAA
jgi:hypothetical protein